ncbi:sulfite oxidase-like oxidoreductase [Mycobacterium sp. JS623]|uniref:sulfite oxidase n=1 Tax=Mycobacterium sp. JS623 TaxID=212767 RepID=UPI0002A58736|nr:sulfite oxidase-like oxidoreductase [Mycobacterium sp. JS623]
MMTAHTAPDTAPLWGKRDDMIVRSAAPFNAEPPPSVLASAEITPVDAFYARNHGVFPDISAAQWQLTVDGVVDTPLTLTFDQLRADFAHHSVVATLACAGNRRAELLRVRPIPGKDPWEHGAISTAQWGGVRLADVLKAAGVDRRDGLHLEFLAPDIAGEARPVQSYGSSIPLHKAMSEEVLLAWQMNDQPLLRAHGGPVRVVVPGYIGARSVKWVRSIIVRNSPSHNYFQALDYRILPPEADPDTAAEGEGISLSTLPLNCDILTPTDGDHIPAGELTIRGWAMDGDGQGIGRVDVSLDGGHTWRQAELHAPPSKWAWWLWSLTVDVTPGPLNITARAWDSRGMTQPEFPSSLWNPRGYGNNAYARIDLHAV